MSTGRMPDVSGYDLPGVIKPGNYKATLEKVEEKFTRNGDPAVNVRLSLDDTSDSVFDFCMIEYQGKPFEFGLRRLKQLSVMAGLGEAGRYDMADLEGKKVGVQVGYDKDTDFPRVRNYIKIDEPDIEWVNGTGGDDLPF
jgi:hypothetical protein